MSSDDDISQSEIDRIVSLNTKKLRVELMAAIGNKLREKDEEIQQLGKLNLSLQERVNSLYAENRLLREMAQTIEAASNSLRRNLEQIKTEKEFQETNSVKEEMPSSAKNASTNSSGPVTEDEITAFVLRKNKQVTTQDLIDQFKSRLITFEDYNSFAVALSKISEIHYIGIQYRQILDCYFREERRAKQQANDEQQNVFPLMDSPTLEKKLDI